MEYPPNHDHCLNCLSTMQDGAVYCSQCGQKRWSPHDRSVWHLVVESVGDFFHLDSKFFATVQPLLFRPGLLTTEYLAGRKARYFNPFKLFLFLSFLYFFTSGLVAHRNKNEAGSIEKLPPAETGTVQLRTSQEIYSLKLDADYAKRIDIPDDSLRKMVHKQGLNMFVSKKFPEASAFQRYMIKKVIRNRVEGETGESMGKILPKLVFVLILFFAFLLKVIYRKKRMPYFDHLIFSLHFLSFFFLLFWFNELLSFLSRWFTPVMILLLLGYLFFALRKTYPMKIWPAAWRFVLFLIGSLVTLLIFFILAASISVMLI